MAGNGIEITEVSKPVSYVRVRTRQQATRKKLVSGREIAGLLNLVSFCSLFCIFPDSL